MSKNNFFFRRFTKELEDTNGEVERTVYDMFEWAPRDVYMENWQTHEVLVDKKGVMFPSHFSQNACNIITSLYLRHSDTVNEMSYKDVVHRLVEFWTLAMVNEGIIEPKDKPVVYDELAWLMLAQAWAPNSPQFFNTGLRAVYGVDTKAEGLYFYDKATGQIAEPLYAYARTNGSACFIRKVKDSLCGEDSLSDELSVESLLFKYGAGVGVNWSPIRGKGESLSAGGKSSGLISFLRVSDRNAGAIKSGGTTRRASKINILNIDHPEVMEFIEWKSREEDKATALSKMGYGTGIDSESYETVSGQNGNNSVRIDDSVMKDIVENPEAVLRLIRRTDKKVEKELNLKEVWERLCWAAWRCGDPAVQFDTTINAWHTCPKGEDGKLSNENRINGSNPCSEYMFLDDTACNLASINVAFFYDTESREFDFQGFIHAVYLVQHVLEATIHWGCYPHKAIAYNSYKYRTTGVGLTNMSALLMAMALPFDSDEGRNVAASLCSLMTASAYLASTDMAGKVGAFDCYSINKDSMLGVIKGHMRAANIGNSAFIQLQKIKEPEYGQHKQMVGIDHSKLPGEFSDVTKMLNKVWKLVAEHGYRQGFRNAQVSLLAPTGTIAFAMDCGSTSSEPFFGHIVTKKLSSGGSMSILNPWLVTGLRRLGYTEVQINDITEYVLRKDANGMFIDGKIEGAPHLREEHLPIFDTASKCGTGNRYISPEAHVRMVAAINPHLSGGISKTVNLPNEATPEDISKIYILAWTLGVKSIALYRDGCKLAQPLKTSIISSKDSLEELDYQSLLKFAKEHKTTKRVKPTGIRPTNTHEAVMGGITLYVHVSYYQNSDKMCEIYISAGKQGSLTKGLLDTLSITISRMLQSGTPPQDVAKSYRGHKFEPCGLVSGHPYIKMAESIPDLISKVIDIELGDYSRCQIKPDWWVEANPNYNQIDKSKLKKEDYLLGEVCTVCSSPSLVRNGTCKVCTECGNTTGCS